MIIPIETRYKGYKFRSRLEARWAVFFDKMNIEFLYELEGFKLPSGNYLPDFWLPQVKMWAEVKPASFSNREYTLAYELAETTGYPCLLLTGEPDLKPYESITIKKGLNEQGKLISDDIDLLHCLVSWHLEEGRFYYLQKDIDDDLDNYGKDYEAAVYAAKQERFGT